MIIGIGVDLVNIPRMQKLIAKNGERFLQRLFHEHELNHRPKLPEQHAQYFASRWAVKEATVKALGKSGIGSKQMYICKDPSTNVPKLILTGEALEQLHKRQIYEYETHVSLSHDQDYAVAMVVLETERAPLSRPTEPELPLANP